MMDVEEDQSALTLTECVDILEQNDTERKKPPVRSDGSSVLDILKEKAGEEGLTSQQITQLVQAATSKTYSDTVINQIIKCLIPRDGVPSECVLEIISKMCASAISINIQVSFLKWLIMVYEWIDDKETVHCLYGMIFLFLDNDALCPYICHLLYSMTRKEDVEPFRIRKLLDLLVKVGKEPYLIGLLFLYKIHSPHLVSVNIPNIKKAFFKRKDSKWLDIVWNVKSRANKEQTTSTTLDKDAVTFVPTAKKRRKDLIIPSSLAICPSISDGVQNTRITFDQIVTFNDLLKHFDKVEFPSQMGIVLESRHLQHLLACTRDQAPVVRLNFWLQQTLYEELLTAPSGVTRERVTKFLRALLNFVSFYQKPLSSLESCLSQYLLTWNGADYKPLILLLVSRLQIRPFHKLNNLVLEPLRRLFFSSPVEFKCQILTCLTEMLLNLAISTYTFPKEDKRSQFESTSASPLSVSDLPKSGDEKRQISLIIKDLIGFVDRICIVALQLEADHILLQHCILCFFEQASTLPLHYPIQFVYVPSPAIVYRLLFATNPMAVSRLCNLIVNYKDSFECLKRAPASCSTDEDFLDGFENLGQFNQYILDISDTLWRNKAFEDRPESLCYSIPRSITDSLEIPHINERFSIVNHVAFVYLAKKFLVQTQAEDMKLNPSLIRGKTRSVYLEYLQQNNFQGVTRFLNTFIKQKPT